MDMPINSYIMCLKERKALPPPPLLLLPKNINIYCYRPSAQAIFALYVLQRHGMVWGTEKKNRSGDFLTPSRTNRKKTQ